MKCRPDRADSLPCRGAFPGSSRRRRWVAPGNLSDVGHQITVSSEPHSSVVLAPYGLTDTTASSSLHGCCRDVIVPHSPGFTVWIAANPLSGTFMRIVTYWLGASVDMNSAGRTRFSSIL